MLTLQEPTHNEIGSNRHRRPRTFSEKIRPFAKITAGVAAIAVPAYFVAPMAKFYYQLTENAWSHTVGTPNAVEAKVDQIANEEFGDDIWTNCIDAEHEGTRSHGAGFYDKHLFLDNGVCATIEDMMYNPTNDSNVQNYGERVFAALAIAHEISHKDSGDEQVTQCYAIQRIPAVARALGFSSADADAMTFTAAHDLKYSPEYTPPKACHANGSLDLGIITDQPHLFPYQDSLSSKFETAG